MENSKPSIFITQLILVGSRKDYVIHFTRGVNIIYGDSATGKSSVLECINYLLGSSKLIYDREIESSVNYIQMEVFLNGKPNVIKRNIFRPTDFIEVYTTSLESMGSVFPKRLTPSYNVEVGPDGYFSDFLMAALNIPTIRIRQAPSKADSAMVRLSFRDLFKFCYLKQDDVGSKSILGAATILEAKSKETFKYIFNLLDTNVSDAQAELAVLTAEHRRLIEKYRAVSDFLRETEFDSETVLVDTDSDLARQEIALKTQLSGINVKMVADSENYSTLKGALSEIVAVVALTEKEIADSNTAVDRYIRLKNDYLTDVSKLKSIRQAKSLIGAPEESFSCPVCESAVTLENIRQAFSIDDGDRVAFEINTLVRRIRELDELIRSERDKANSLIKKLTLLTDDRDKARRLLDEETAQMITPYLSERDGIASELAKIEERRGRVTHLLKVRNQQKSIFSAISDYADKVDSMQVKLTHLKSAAPSLEEVVSRLGDYLSDYLRHVKIKDQREVAISNRTFLPVLRGRDYREITSGGLRTVLSIGHYLGITKAAIAAPTNIPTFLMVDTVGKYLGKTQDQYNEIERVDDDNEELSDPAKYLNIYDYMFQLAQRAEKDGVSVQIILVDNDVPPSVQSKYDESVVAHFNKEGAGGLPRGLIDDAYLNDS